LTIVVTSLIRTVCSAFIFRAVHACLLTRDLINHWWAFHNFTIYNCDVQLDTKMNWLDFEVKRSKIKVTARLHVVRLASWEAFFTCLQNVGTYFDETYHSSHYLVKDSKIKVTDNIFENALFRWRHRSTFHCHRPSGYSVDHICV